VRPRAPGATKSVSGAELSHFPRGGGARGRAALAGAARHRRDKDGGHAGASGGGGGGHAGPAATAGSEEEGGGRMDGFLVLGRCTMDDVPVCLCGSRKEALDVISCTSAEDVRSLVEGVYDVDGVSGVVCLAMVEFRNGAPMPLEVIRRFDGV